MQISDHSRHTTHGGAIVSCNCSEGDLKKINDLVAKLKPQGKGQPGPHVPEVSKILLKGGYLQVWDDGEFRDATDDELLFRLAAVYLFGERSLYLGKDLCTTDRWYDTSEWPYHWKCRDCCTELTVVFSHPRLEEIWGDVQGCAIGAAAAATILGLIATPATAEPTFKGVFYGCLVAKFGDWVNQIGIRFSRDARCGSAHDC
jgi:hypothetical protein